MENEENRDFMDKNVSKDEWVTFCEFIFWSSLIILSLLDTQIFLRALLEGVAYLEFWSKKEKEEQEITIEHQDQKLQRVFLVGTELYV